MTGKQGISHRRTQEIGANSTNSDSLRNPGIILAIVRQVAYRYLLLYEHIHSLLRKSVSYMSPTSQNQLIGIFANYIIQIWLIEEIKEVKCRSISADEVTSVFVYVHVCKCICVYTCMYLCVCTRICMHIYIKIYIYIYKFILLLYIYIYYVIH